MTTHTETVRQAFDLMNAGQTQQAESLLRRHLRKFPKDVDALRILATTLLYKGLHAQASFFAAQANELRPRDFDILSVLGFARANEGKPAQALEAFQEAVGVAPEEASAWVGLGVALTALDRYDEALPAFEKALTLDPSDTAASKNLALCHTRFGNANASLRALRAALKYDPHNEKLLLQAASMSNYADSVSPHDARSIHNALARAIETKAGAPRTLAALPLDNRVLRVGLLSSDFREHSCSYFLEPLLSRFADNEFAREVGVTLVCLSAARAPDAVTQRLRSTGHPWHDVSSLDDAACAALIRREQIDVLIDCGGYTLDSRVAVLAHRAAPVQMTYLGYPNTTALKQCDYRVVDAVTDPLGNEAHCSERLIRLDPHFLCYAPRGEAQTIEINPSPPHERTGRPTFASFNSPLKMVDATIAVWARLLHEVSSSRLILKAKHDLTKVRLLHGFQSRGIDPERVTVLPILGNALDHLALYNDVDVALDTFPYNGTTTTYETLFMGVPVVAFAGDRHASRVSASILTCAGASELVAPSIDAYVQVASTLVTDQARLRHYRTTLRDQLARSPSCDRDAFCARFAAAMHTAWKERVTESK